MKRPTLNIKELLVPMTWTVFLSVIYNIFYIYGVVFLGSTWAVNVFAVILGLVSSVGMYWICTKAWKKTFQGDLSTLLPILIVEGVLLAVVLGILAPLRSVVYEMDAWVLTLPYQIVCAILVVLAQPLQLCMYTGLAQGIVMPKELGCYVKDKFCHSFKDIWNRYCLILLMVIFLDSMVQGPFSISTGFDAYSILSNILLFGNPMFSWMLGLFMMMGLGLSANGLVYIGLLLIIGLVCMVMECSLLMRVKTAWIDHGTDKIKTHKTKK